MELPSVSCNVLCPLSLPEVVLVKVTSQDTEKDVVINPLGDGADATRSQDLGTSVTQTAVNATTRSQPKTITCVDCKAIVFVQTNDQARPLLGLDREAPVRFLDITYCSLRTRGEAPYEEANDRKSTPGAGVLA